MRRVSKRYHVRGRQISSTIAGLTAHPSVEHDERPRSVSAVVASLDTLAHRGDICGGRPPVWFVRPGSSRTLYPASVRPTIRDLKAYVPAKDFELSKRFYSALGFAMSEGWGGTADFELGGSRFRLQNYYVADWANNFMMVMRVDDVDAWHRLATEVARDPDFAAIRVAEIEEVGGSRVLHVVDPSGVLLIFVQ